VLIDALVLAGGRSSRLNSTPKAQLRYRGRTLLENTVAAVSGLRSVVVVGDATAQELPAEVLVTREDPAFGGPAAAIGAGLDALRAADEIHADAVHADFVMVLACDMPNIAAAIPVLLGELDGDADSADGLIALDAQHRLQPLAAAYRTSSLLEAVALARDNGPLEGSSVFQLIRTLRLREIVMPDDATDDVDSWDDASRWEIEDFRSHNAREQK
jgi:molybdopterin-guanine dinucleotide biosynthesis protein A